MTASRSLPDGWRWVTLGEVLAVADVGVWGDADPGGVSVLRSTNFRNDGTLDLCRLSIRAIAPERRTAKRLLPGDILLERSGGGPSRPVGRVCLFKGDDREHVFGNFCQRLRPRNGICDSVFLFWYLYFFHMRGGTEQFQNRTTGIRNLQYKRYLSSEVPLPPIEEQRRIVSDLERRMAAVERVRRATEAQLAAAEAMSAALVREVLARSPATRSVRLGDIANYINGRAFKPSDWEPTGTPIVRIQNLTSPRTPHNFYTGDVAPRHRITDGDLLVAWSASLGVYMWERGPAILNQHIFKVEEDPTLVNRHYMYYALQVVMNRLKAQAHGATMQHVTKPRFEATPIPLPPPDEQRRIVEDLERQTAAAALARRAAEAQLATTEALPAAILRRAFGEAA